MSLNVDTCGVLLIDAENAFNSINQKVMFSNLKFICPHHCYLHNQLLCNSIKVIFCRWGEILFTVETTQGDPTALGAYTSGILALIKFLLEFILLNEMNAKEVAFADDFSIACNFNSFTD